MVTPKDNNDELNAKIIKEMTFEKVGNFGPKSSKVLQLDNLNKIQQKAEESGLSINVTNTDGIHDDRMFIYNKNGKLIDDFDVRFSKSLGQNHTGAFKNIDKEYILTEQQKNEISKLKENGNLIDLKNYVKNIVSENIENVNPEFIYKAIEEEGKIALESQTELSSFIESNQGQKSIAPNLEGKKQTFNKDKQVNTLTKLTEILMLDGNIDNNDAKMLSEMSKSLGVEMGMNGVKTQEIKDDEIYFKSNDKTLNIKVEFSKDISRN